MSFRCSYVAFAPYHNHSGQLANESEGFPYLFNNTPSTLAELLQQTGTKIMQLTEGLDINHRTAQRRIKEPETLTIKELLVLSALLRVPEQQLLDLIRDEFQSRPAQSTAEPDAEEVVLPPARKTTPKWQPKSSK